MTDQWWSAAKQAPGAIPFRNKFDAARDPLTARNAIGAVDAKYVTDAIAAAGGGGSGNVSNSGTPTSGQYAKWTDATHVQGVAPATVLSDIGAQPAGSYLTTAVAAATYQPLDADLTALAALTGTNTIYYRSASNVWSPVVVSTGLAFSGGNLTATSAGGNVSNSGTPTAGQIAVWTDATHIQGVAASTLASPTPPQGRLTLQTATPVMTTTQSAKSTIYYTPYLGNQIVLYNGTSMVMTTFAELSVATTNTANSPAAIGASKVNDWFVWDSGGGTLRLVHGPDWTNDTTRSAGTALVMVAGILLNNASITNGPAAQRGTYVGTTRSNGSSQLDWHIATATAGGSATCLLSVWNAYNRVLQSAFCKDTTATVSPGAGISGYGNTIIRIVRGLNEEDIKAQWSVRVNVPGGGFVILFIYLDGAAVTTSEHASGIAASALDGSFSSFYSGYPSAGSHTFQPVHQIATTATISGGDYENFYITMRM